MPALGWNMISASHSLLSFRYLRMKLPRYDARKQNYEPTGNVDADFEQEAPLENFEEQAEFEEFDNTESRPNMLSLTQFPEGLSQINGGKH